MNTTNPTAAATAAADVYVGDTLAAEIHKSGGHTYFRYREDYLRSGGRAVATTLPLTDKPVITPAGALPAFFTGLLPEGRRLSALRRNSKTSADDELGLLLAVGADTVGNVSVVPAGVTPRPASTLYTEGSHISFETLLSDRGISDPVALAGAQEKASARTIAIPAGSDAILKLTPPEYPHLVENEAACLMISREVHSSSYPIVSAKIIADSAGRSGLLVQRFDRGTNGSERYAVEDAAQLLGIYPADKYSVSYEEVTAAVMRVVVSPALALRSLALQLAMAWLTGNGDLHAKNISVLDSGEGFEVSPVYDIPSTLPYGDHNLALPVGGQKSGLSRKRFVAYCRDFGMPTKVSDTLADQALKATLGAAEQIAEAVQADPHTRRDISRVLRNRRQMWGE